MFLRRLAAADTHHRRIARGAIAAALFVVAGKLGAVAREVAIAWGYGTSDTVDAFQLSFNVATWLPMVLAATSTGLLVPRLVAVRERGVGREQFVAELNGAALAVALLATIITAAAVIPAVGIIGGGLAAPIQKLAIQFTFAMLPVSFLTVLVGLFYVRLQSREEQVFAATEALPPLAIAVLILVTRAHSGVPLVMGLVGGSVLQVFVLWALTKAHPHGVGGTSLRRQSPEWANIYRDLFVLSAAQALATLSAPLDNAFASRSGPGGIATYGYALRLLGLLISFGSVVFARAILPVLSDLAATAKHERGRHVARKWTGVLLLLGTITAAAAWVVAPLLVRVAFQRGAFTGQDAATVAQVLRYGLFQLPFSFGALASVQWFAATRRYDRILAAAAAAVVAKLILNLLLFPTLGLAGLALATAGMYAVTTAILLWLLRNR